MDFKGNLDAVPARELSASSGNEGTATRNVISIAIKLQNRAPTGVLDLFSTSEHNTNRAMRSDRCDRFCYFSATVLDSTLRNCVRKTEQNPKEDGVRMANLYLRRLSLSQR